MLSDGGENLPLVLSKIRSRTKRELVESLRQLFEGIHDIHLTVDGGNVLLFLEEVGGREIPATRLSDGTLRFLSLLAILLHPDPPPLVAIDEPELGLHPDIIPHIAELLVKASERTQLVVTTHSRMLVDALSDRPSSVVVCEREDGESRFERLDAEALKTWLDQYSLGTLWSMGELGGNRW
jgi:predicted ATPase